MEWERTFTFGVNAAKIRIILKNAPHKSCSELNFLQNTQWTHVCISPSSGVRRLQRLPYNVLEWESGFILKLNAAKNAGYF